MLVVHRVFGTKRTNLHEKYDHPMTLKIAGGVGRVLEVVPQGSGSSIRYWNRSNDFGSGVPDSVQAILDCR